jgi:hypothetical protein
LVDLMAADSSISRLLRVGKKKAQCRNIVWSGQ